MRENWRENWREKWGEEVIINITRMRVITRMTYIMRINHKIEMKVDHTEMTVDSTVRVYTVRHGKNGVAIADLCGWQDQRLRTSPAALPANFSCRICCFLQLWRTPHTDG